MPKKIIYAEDAITVLQRCYCGIEVKRKRPVTENERFFYFDVLQGLEDLPSAQPEIIRCKDCKYWEAGYITERDDFIPPRCGKYQQMVGHSSDDFCSYAERKEDE